MLANKSTPVLLVQDKNNLSVSCIQSLSFWLTKCLHIVIGVSPSAQEEAEKDTAAPNQEQSNQYIDQCGGPEGKQVHSLIAVCIDGSGILDIIRFVDPVDPHITSNEPAEKKGRGDRVPGYAKSVEWVGGPISGLLCAGQTGQQGQHQAKHPQNHQINGDVVFPGALMQVRRTNSYLSYRHDANKHFATC